LNQSYDCLHCGELTYYPITQKIEDIEAYFCCAGCSAVYQFLHKQGLEEYYQIKANSPELKESAPIAEIPKDYFYLDQNDFLNQYTQIESDGNREVLFYVEGVHCLACLWLIEKLPQFVNGVLEARLDIAQTTLKLKATQDCKLSEVAGQLASWGYRPHILKNDRQANSLKEKEDRDTLVRIGVAGACAGNIMILAVSLYAGAFGSWAHTFRWLSFALALPALTFSAKPFYAQALASLRRKSVSIDVPIVFAILLGTIIGLYNLTIYSEHIYFDSLTILVFLLLSSRFALKKIQQKGLEATELAGFFTKSIAHLYDQRTKEYVDTLPTELRIGDFIKILPGEMIPADARIIEGESTLNTALLTGEAIPQKVQPTDLVYSGTLNLDLPLVAEVGAVGKQTRLGNILDEVERSWLQKSRLSTLSDKLSGYFVSSVLLLSAGTFTYFASLGLWSTALERALALVIVTCPCALGLSVPLVLSRTLGKAAKKGLIIKGEKVVEDLATSERIFLDKTGTLTYGQFRVTKWNELTNKNLKGIALALEMHSKHPIAKAIVQFIQEQGPQNFVSLEEIREVIGVGVSGSYQDSHFILKALDKSSENQTATWVGLYENDRLVVEIELEDHLRFESPEVIKELKSFGLTPYLLSGDHKSVVKMIGEKLGIIPRHIFGRVTPEEKRKILRSYQNTIMVGDGANDALALSDADVGIAVQGSMDVSLRAADVYLSTPGVKSILKLIILSKETIKLIRRNFSFSLGYNILGATAAMLGFITPLWAAVLMPISSLTVLLSTLFGTKKLREVLS